MDNLDKKQAKRILAARNRSMLIKNRHEVARALEILFASGYISRSRLYIENFMRGMFFALGGLIGVTVGLAITLWILSLFDQVPLIGPVIESISDQIKSGNASSLSQ